MEFWGVEVKPGQTLKVKPDSKLIHISQAALGEVKVGMEGPKYVPLRLKIDDKDFFIGSLSAEIRPQVQFDLVLEKEFDLSHDWKYGSVYFLGYTSKDLSDSEDSDMSESSESDISSSDEDEVMAAPESGHAEPEPVTADAAKNDAENGDTNSSSDNVDDSDDDEDDESSEEEQELPQKGKKVKA